MNSHAEDRRHIDVALHDYDLEEGDASFFGGGGRGGGGETSWSAQVATWYFI